WSWKLLTAVHSIYQLEFLRVYSPAADSKIGSVSGEKVIFGRRHVGIMSVGNYGNNMRNYIKTLKKHGLNRDPKRK
ncbi:PyrE-like protein, partial [Bienertia sinuspersici]